MTIRSTVSAVLLVMACVSCRAQTYEDIPLRMGTNTYHLSHIQTNWLRRNIYGVYTPMLDLTAGKSLHLFPDQTFALVSWSDIGPETLIAEGTYTFATGYVSLTHSFIAQQCTDTVEDVTYHVLGGYRYISSNVVTDFKTIVTDNDGFQMITNGQHYFGYMIRGREYYDWKSIRRDLERKRSTQQGN
jgi:hypothetical protein